MSQPLIVITGPTASGKTGLALELAKRYNGEIICADSRTIYKGMDVGTAKPTIEEQARVPHHLLDMIEPGEKFTVADFQAAAYEAIKDIRSRGKVPFLVGGTGLYIDAVVLEYEWPKAVAHPELETKTIEELQLMINTQQLVMPTNVRNKRHLMNTLNRGKEQGNKRDLPRETTFVVAITTEAKMLDDRIRIRAHEMFKNGVIDETKGLAEQYGWQNEAMTSNIYPLVKQVLDGNITQDTAIEQFIVKDRRLAKRQRTWLKRHTFVQWFNLDDARAHIETILG